MFTMRTKWNELHQELGVKEKKTHWGVATIKGIDYIRRSYSSAKFISYIWLTSIVLDYVVLPKLWKRFAVLYGCFSMWRVVLQISFSVEIGAAEPKGCKPPEVFDYHIPSTEELCPYMLAQISSHRVYGIQEEVLEEQERESDFISSRNTSHSSSS